jgi:hypothetical protein
MKTRRDYSYSFKHVQQRLLERYHIESFNIEDYERMNRAVRLCREYNKICKEAKRIYGLYKGKDNNGDQEMWRYYGLYNKRRRQIITVFSISKDRVTTVLPP